LDKSSITDSIMVSLPNGMSVGIAHFGAGSSGFDTQMRRDFDVRRHLVMRGPRVLRPELDLLLSDSPGIQPADRDRHRLQAGAEGPGRRRAPDRACVVHCATASCRPGNFSGKFSEPYLVEKWVGDGLTPEAGSSDVSAARTIALAPSRQSEYAKRTQGLLGVALD
jgi:hypothetical protein